MSLPRPKSNVPAVPTTYLELSSSSRGVDWRMISRSRLRLSFGLRNSGSRSTNSRTFSKSSMVVSRLWAMTVELVLARKRVSWKYSAHL